MTSQTMSTLTAVLASDKTIGPVRGAEMLKRMAEAPEGASIPARLVVRPKEAARALGVTTRTIANMAYRGILNRVTLPGRKRTLGYRWEDILRLGGEQAA